MVDPAILDKQHALGVAGRGRAVGNHNNGLPILVHLVKEAQNFLTGIGIQRTGGLIG